MTSVQLVPISTEFKPKPRQLAVMVRYASPPWPSYNEAARSEGVPIQTAKHWRSRPAFSAALDDERRRALAQHLERIRTRLIDASDAAVDTIVRTMDADDAGAALRAAVWLLESTIGKAPETYRHEGAVRFTLAPGDGHHVDD